MLYFIQLSWILVVVTATLLRSTECGNVVFIPFPTASHVRYHAHGARALTKLGHKVWLTVPTYLLERGHWVESGFEAIPYESLPRIEERIVELSFGRYFEGKAADVYGILHLATDVSDDILKNDTFLQILRAKKPDLIVLDYLQTVYPLAVLPYKLGKPFVFLGPGYDAIGSRIPFSPAETPATMFPYNNKMTFMQRLRSLIFYILITVNRPVMSTNAVSVFAPELPHVPLDMLVARAEVWLVEVDPILDYPRPSLPNVKLIGGLAARPAQTLPSQFQSFMDSAAQGVVIVTFGTYVLGLPQDISDKLFQVFLELPMKVVFRSNLTSPDAAQILTSSWLPQNDLLSHGNTKVFVNHGGNSGQYEALYHAVPMVTMPLCLDQFYNAERVRSKGLAEVVDLRTCTAEQLRTVILRVAGQPRYKQAVARHSHLFRQQQGIPMEKAAFWLDHVMRYGGGYMRSAGQDMPLYQFLMLDIVLSVVVLLVLATGLLSACVWYIFRLFCTKKVKLE